LVSKEWHVSQCSQVQSTAHKKGYMYIQKKWREIGEL
jgi:hypothetical protein